MDDVTAKKAMPQLPYGINPNFEKLHKSFPSSAYLRARSPRNIPKFSFEYGDTGAGADVGIAHNWAAFDAIKVVPRYGNITTVPPIDVELFGTKYSAPIGIAPMGGPSLVWPGADLMMAKAAQRARVPYTLGTAGGGRALDQVETDGVIVLVEAIELQPEHIGRDFGDFFDGRARCV